eukprot:2115916-Amphidinium_carterae.1
MVSVVVGFAEGPGGGLLRNCLQVDGIDEGSAQQPNLLKTGSFIRSSSQYPSCPALILTGHHTGVTTNK